MATIVTGKPALKYETVTRSLSTNWWNRPVANSVIVAVTNGWWAIKTEACHTLTAEPYTPTQELYRGKGTYTYISLSTWYQLVAEVHSVMWTWMIEKRNKGFIIGGSCAEKVCNKSVRESSLYLKDGFNNKRIYKRIYLEDYSTIFISLSANNC